MNAQGTTAVLWWPGRVLAEDDLRRHWTSQHEIVVAPKTIVTPLAVDFLKARRVAMRRDNQKGEAPAGAWGVALQGAPAGTVAAVQAALQENRTLRLLPCTAGDTIGWARTLADMVRRGDPPGAILVCEQAALAACAANKVSGVRAACVGRPADVAAAKKAFGPNLFAVAATGPTYFELRQLVKLAAESPPACPEPAAKALTEIDRAHR